MIDYIEVRPYRRNDGVGWHGVSFIEAVQEAAAKGYWVCDRYEETDYLQPVNQTNPVKVTYNVALMCRDTNWESKKSGFFEGVLINISNKE